MMNSCKVQSEFGIVQTNQDNTEIGSNDSTYQLSRKGTVIARSSDFTRDSVMLHSNDYEVVLEGTADRGQVDKAITAGVGFVSAALRLDKIFDKTTRTNSAAAPPPPPPPLVSSRKQQTHLAKAAVMTSNMQLEKKPYTPQNTVGTSSVSSNESTGSLSLAKQWKQTLATPPPLQGLFVRSQTRHRKVIRTRLADLSNTLQGQEPQIRGGVAIYKAINQSDQERFGKEVEINAVEYVHQLKETVKIMERDISILHGKLEQHKTDRPAADNTSRTVSRLSLAAEKKRIQIQSKGEEKTSRRFSLSKTAIFYSRTAEKAARNGVCGASSLSPSRKSSDSHTGAKDDETIRVSFPDGFGSKRAQVIRRVGSSASGSVMTTEVVMPPDNNACPRTYNKATACTAFPTRTEQSSEVVSRGWGRVCRRTTDLRSSCDAIVSGPGPKERRSLSTDKGTLQETEDMSVIFSDDIKLSSSIGAPDRQLLLSQGRSAAQIDRKAAPMPRSVSRNMRNANFGRTQSFSVSTNTKLAQNLTFNNREAAKPLRSYSVHHESNVEMSSSEQQEVRKLALKQTRGFRNFFQLRRV